MINTPLCQLLSLALSFLLQLGLSFREFLRLPLADPRARCLLGGLRLPPVEPPNRYAGKLASPAFLRGEGLPVAPWLVAAEDGAAEGAALREALAVAVPQALADPGDF